MHKEKMSETSYADICEMKKRLVEIVKSEFSKGIEQIDAKEMGEVTDMIKDLAEAEKLCKEACYYDSIVDAMEEGSDDPYNMRMGYRNRMMPYKPYKSEEPYIDAYLYDNDPSNLDRRFRMGYRDSTSRDGRMNRSRDSMGRYTSNSGSNRSGYDDGRDWDPDMDPHYSRAVNQYKSARRHYTESHSQVDKEEMNRHANEHIADTIQTIKEMWEDADPTLRKKMKADLTSLVGTMNA